MSSSPTEHERSATSSASPAGVSGLVQVVMPKMGISVSEGTVLEWRKQPGDWVEADETIADVTTDKVDVEIPSPASGRVARLVVEAGDTVPVGEPIAEIDGGARAGEAHPVETPSPEIRISGESSDEGTDRSGFISPVVRRIADKHSIDLGQVEGTGIGGRIRKRDVLAHVENGNAKAPPMLHSESPYKPDSPAEPAEERTGDRVPLTPMRKAIAEHMLASRATSAHCTTIVEVDMSRIAGRRAELKAKAAGKRVPTYLAFVARAAVSALGEFPVLNASLEGDEIVHHDDVNLGIAVALDAGLIVPVVPRAQTLNVQGLAESIADLADRARNKRLDPDDVHGGTFTITNPGQFGAVLATPIINQPQVAILDLEAIVKRPVVVSTPVGAADAERSSPGEMFDSIAIRPMTYLCMSWDHRVLDGADAARFLSSVKRRLEGGDYE